jgi:cytochrome d ubiquinol oxidase subunit I
MPSPTLLELSRWQFAFTIIFHMTFPAITVGLAVFLALVYGLYLRTRNPVYLQVFRFWKRIFAVGFALGVVAGAVITFELGLNWGPFANATGPVLAPIIGMEVVTGFFLEAGFIGVMLYGDGRVKERTMFISTCIVALGTLLSTTWIMLANSWMQTPSGFTIVNGQFQPTSWGEVIFNPSVVWRYPHMLLAVLISTAWLIGGIAAYYLIKGRVQDFARRTLSLTLGVVAVLLPLQLMLGDHVAAYVIRYQPAKLQAIEGNWTSTNTGYNVFAIPDMTQQKDKVLITIPKLGSVLGAKDLSGNTPTPGLLLTPKADRPNMWPVFWGFRVMFYASILMFAAALIGIVLRLRKKLYSAGWFHKLLVWMTPIGVLAIIAGWVTAETGRQPYVVYGHLRTSAAVSHLAPGGLVFSLAGFVCIYLALLTGWVVYVVRSVRRGPDPGDITDQLDPEGSTPPPTVLASVGSTGEGA